MKKRNVIIWIIVYVVSTLLLFLSTILNILYPELMFHRLLLVPGGIGSTVAIVVLIVAALRNSKHKE